MNFNHTHNSSNTCVSNFNALKGKRFSKKKEYFESSDTFHGNFEVETKSVISQDDCSIIQATVDGEMKMDSASRKNRYRITLDYSYNPNEKSEIVEDQALISFTQALKPTSPDAKRCQTEILNHFKPVLHSLLLQLVNLSQENLKKKEKSRPKPKPRRQTTLKSNESIKTQRDNDFYSIRSIQGINSTDNTNYDVGFSLSKLDFEPKNVSEKCEAKQLDPREKYGINLETDTERKYEISVELKESNLRSEGLENGIISVSARVDNHENLDKKLPLDLDHEGTNLKEKPEGGENQTTINFIGEMPNAIFDRMEASLFRSTPLLEHDCELNKEDTKKCCNEESNSKFLNTVTENKFEAQSLSESYLIRRDDQENIDIFKLLSMLERDIHGNEVDGLHCQNEKSDLNELSTCNIFGAPVGYGFNIKEPSIHEVTGNQELTVTFIAEIENCGLLPIEETEIELELRQEIQNQEMRFVSSFETNGENMSVIVGYRNTTDEQLADTEPTEESKMQIEDVNIQSEQGSAEPTSEKDLDFDKNGCGTSPAYKEEEWHKKFTIEDKDSNIATRDGVTQPNLGKKFHSVTTCNLSCRDKKEDQKNDLSNCDYSQIGVARTESHETRENNELTSSIMAIIESKLSFAVEHSEALADLMTLRTNPLREIDDSMASLLNDKQGIKDAEENQDANVHKIIFDNINEKECCDGRGENKAQLGNPDTLHDNVTLVEKSNIVEPGNIGKKIEEYEDETKFEDLDNENITVTKTANIPENDLIKSPVNLEMDVSLYDDGEIKNSSCSAVEACSHPNINVNRLGEKDLTNIGKRGSEDSDVIGFRLKSSHDNKEKEIEGKNQHIIEFDSQIGNKNEVEDIFNVLESAPLIKSDDNADHSGVVNKRSKVCNAVFDITAESPILMIDEESVATVKIKVVTEIASTDSNDPEDITENVFPRIKRNVAGGESSDIEPNNEAIYIKPKPSKKTAVFEEAASPLTDLGEEACGYQFIETTCQQLEMELLEKSSENKIRMTTGEKFDGAGTCNQLRYDDEGNETITYEKLPNRNESARNVRFKCAQRMDVFDQNLLKPANNMDISIASDVDNDGNKKELSFEQNIHISLLDSRESDDREKDLSKTKNSENCVQQTCQLFSLYNIAIEQGGAEEIEECYSLNEGTETNRSPSTYNAHIK